MEDPFQSVASILCAVRVLARCGAMKINRWGPAIGGRLIFRFRFGTVVTKV